MIQRKPMLYDSAYHWFQRVIRTVCIWSYHSGFLPSISLAGVLCGLMWILHGRFDFESVLAYCLLMVAMNLADRLANNPEDHGDEDTTPAVLVNRHRRLFIGVQVVSIFGLLALIFHWPWLGVSTVVSAALCTCYFVRIPVIGLRIKQLTLAKPLVVPLLMLAMQLMFSGAWPPLSEQTVIICLVLLILFHVGLVLYDLKDLDQDSKAGIRTMASRMSLVSFLRLEGVLLMFGILLSILLPQPMALAFTATFIMALGAVLVLRHRPFGLGMCVFIDGVIGFFPWIGVAVLSL